MNTGYKEVSGTFYHNDTKPEVIDVLERVRHNHVRVEIAYGDTTTGRLWGDKHAGYIGRSCGTIKIPLLVHNNRSLGGNGLLDDCIVRIRYANKKNRKSLGGVLFEIKEIPELIAPILI